MSKIQGVEHIGFSVSDVAATCDLFVNILGFRQVGEDPNSSAVVLSYNRILLTLWQAVEPSQLFSHRASLGLYDLALEVESLESLRCIHSKLQGISTLEIKFLPVPLGYDPARYITFTLPGDIRIRLSISA